MSKDDNPPDWRKEAASLRLAAMCWTAAADHASTGYRHLGTVGIDLGIRVSERLRECAREAEHAAAELYRYADEEQGPPCLREGGRTDDDYPPALALVRQRGSAS